VEALHRELVAFGQLATDDEFRARATLRRARSAPDYKAPFREANPLVSICIPTHTNHAQLFSRSLPSVLGQDYTNLQVVVVGDAAPPETAAGIERIGDPRILYENLSSYGPYPSDPEEPWLVAGTAPINRAFELVTGAWVVVHNDDDALRPSHVSTLLAAARENEAEVAYGELLVHLPDGRTYTLGTFPPELGRFGWQGAIQHRAMCLFEFRLIAARLGQPGDWDRARRMLAAGVRFHMIRDVVGDLYASRQRREL
jgi:glycosyltransferase involved in cell wall biosynthesis